MAHLVSYYTQVLRNLQRTSSKGLISLLNQKQLEELAFKHFSCVNKETGQIGYRCPYTGLDFYDFEDIILEHIIPVSSMGGTVLFNCIPAYKGVNGSDEKGAKHLLDWWKNKGKQYYTPERLDKLLSYMFDAYDIVFANHTIEELENSYEDIDLNENGFSEYYDTAQNSDNPEDIKELSKEDEELKKQAKKAGVISYLGFINDCLRELKDNNYDTTKYEEKLKEYEKYGYFENIERYTLFQNSIKDIIENILGDKKTSLLTYTINFNISKLMNSMKEYESKEDIKNELEKRLNNIERILQENNLSTIEYFKSLRDIQDIDILYKNIDKIAPNELQVFLENIKIGFDTKIDIFINMLTDKQYTSYENGKPNNYNIFSQLNKIPFNGYENIEELKISSFWNNNSHEIIKRLDYLEENSKSNEEKEKYQKARRAIKEYNFTTNLEERINCFIEMLTDKQYTSYENGKPNNYNIFSVLNKIPFKGYESINGLNTSHFWNHNSNEIRNILDLLVKNSETEEEKNKYKRVKRAIEEFNFYTNLEERINCFVEMLTDKQYTSYENGKPNNYNILAYDNKISFKGYENMNGLNTSQFFNRHLDKIINKLNHLIKNSTTEVEKEKYKRAKRAIKEYEFQSKSSATGLILRIDKFIEMLADENKTYTSYENGKPNNNNIFKVDNKIPFKDYESISGLNTSYFWNSNSNEIIKRLDYLEENSKSIEEKEKYQKARRAIKEYKFATNLEERINCFIEMLTDKKYTSYKNGKPDDNNIFKNLNKIPFKDYENIAGLSTLQFWTRNSDLIKNKLQELFEKSKSIEEKEKYQRVRRTIEEYEFTTNIEKRVDIFIEMLTDKKYTSYENTNPNKSNIFSSLNKIPFKGYENIAGLSTLQFWNSNSQKLIIPLLFFNKQYDSDNKVYIDSDKDYSIKEYDTARKAALEYLKVKDINEYIDKLEQKEKKNAKILELINLRNGLKKTLELLKIQESKLIEENKRLHNEYVETQGDIEARRAI